MHDIAIFDMDRTLTKNGTYTAFLLFAAARRQCWRLLLTPLLVLALVAAGVGLLSRKAYKQIGFQLMIGASIDTPTLSSLARAFALRTIATNIHPEARRQITDERRRHGIIVMATAAPDYYANEIGALLGLDAVIATVQARDHDGNYLASIAGANCYGEEKLARIKTWMADEGHDRAESNIRFYSDHISDAPILAWADGAVAVRPNRKLRALAEQHKWKIVDQS